MAGTPIGGRKAAATNKRYNKDFYKIIGRKGGKNGTGASKGFARPERRGDASKWGKVGGRISRKPKEQK